jgi:hypothetical protein
MSWLKYMGKTFMRWLSPQKLMLRAMRYRKTQFKPDPRYKELQDPLYYQSTQWLNDCDRADWPACHPDIEGFTRKLFKELRRRNIPCYVHTQYRSPALQEQLRRQGNSQVSSGPHQRGAAIDIVHAHYHWNAPSHFWDTIGSLGKQIIAANNYKIEWGGDFKTLYDPAHWQLKEWRQQLKISPRAAYDFETGEVIEWKRTPFSSMPAQPKIDGESYYTYLRRHGRKWKIHS